MNNRRINTIVISSALTLGFMLYFYLESRSQLKVSAIDAAVDVIAKEKNILPQTEIKPETQSRDVAATTPNAYAIEKSKLLAFKRGAHTNPSELLAQVDKLSADIMQSELTMPEKAQLNAQLHKLTSVKMAKINPPKITGTTIDLQNNIVYPVFENQ